MNCPRCGKEMVVQGAKAVCGSCRISTAVAKAAPVSKVVPAPVVTPETSTEIDPDDIEEGSANADGFFEKGNQEPDKENKE